MIDSVAWLVMRTARFSRAVLPGAHPREPIGRIMTSLAVIPSGLEAGFAADGGGADAAQAARVETVRSARICRIRVLSSHMAPSPRPATKNTEARSTPRENRVMKPEQIKRRREELGLTLSEFAY